MSSLEKWDFAESFSAFQIASLMLGLDPKDVKDPVELEPVLGRVLTSYRNAASYVDFEIETTGAVDLSKRSEKDLFSSNLLTTVNYLNLFASKKNEAFEVDTSWLVNWNIEEVKNHLFNRVDVLNWISFLKLPSKYDFVGLSSDNSDLTIFSTTPTRHDKTAKTKSDNTLLKIILGISMTYYGFDPNKPNFAGVIKDITEDMLERGMDIDADTVSKYIKKAVELYPNFIK